MEQILSADDRLTGARVAGHDAPLPLDAILVGTRLRIDSALVDGLGIATEENPMGTFVPVDMQKATNVPGSMVASVMADGVMAGALVNMDLVEEEFARAAQSAQTVVTASAEPA